MSGYRGRFAPSPSGPLHFGSLVAALASWLDARAHQGEWLLRFEDVDSERCDAGYIDVIRTQLREHGLLWDAELPAQSSRLSRYEQHLNHWLGDGHAFACHCTRRMLAPFRRDGETRYPGTCRDRGLETAGWGIRFRVPDQTSMIFSDRACGLQQQVVASQCGDFLIRRRNGDYAYQLAVAVDDVEQGITHVVRGQDLLPSTGRQLLLMQTLGGQPPAYLHHRIILDEQQRKLSKATGASALVPGQALVNLRAALEALGQPGDHRAADAPELLQAAVSHWNPRASA